MAPIEDLEPIWKESVSHVPTTITLKLGTKQRLDELGGKNDTYEDIIIRLINENRNLRSEVDELLSLLEKLDVKNRNLLEISTVNRHYNALPFTEGVHIRFSYDIPGVNRYQVRSFNIRIEEVIRRDSILKNIEELTDDSRSIALIHFWLVFKIIRDEFDPMIEAPKRKNIIDPVFWANIWKKIGLSVESYNTDVLAIINDYQEMLNGPGSDDRS